MNDKHCFEHNNFIEREIIKCDDNNVKCLWLLSLILLMKDKRGAGTMMKWEAEEKGYTCNDCGLAMCNCHDKSICCEDETGLCDYFEEISEVGGQE